MRLSFLPLAALLPAAAAMAEPAREPEHRITAREAVEIQLSAPPAEQPRERMTGVESRAIWKRYVDRIGQKLETSADVGGSGTSR
jgi:hypothetical protein